MKFYDKYYTSNYEELITYYPRFYRDVFEMVEILKAHGRIADGMEDNIEQAYLNGFIDYADEATIAKLERFLEIGLNRNRTLEERRRLVKSYFVGFGKISATLIKQMIGAYTNAPVDCRFEPFDDEGNNMLFIDFQRSGNETIYMSDILMLLSKKLRRISHTGRSWFTVSRWWLGAGGNITGTAMTFAAQSRTQPSSAYLF